MNSFLELHASSDYLNPNRPYDTGTWEYIAAASDYVIPFQWTGSSDADYTIKEINEAGSETDVTSRYRSSTLLTGWTATTTGVWSISAGQIASSNPDLDDYITSNTFTLTAKKSIRVYLDTTKFTTPAAWAVYIKKAGVAVYTKEDFTAWDGYIYYTATTTGSDYTVVIYALTTVGTITTTTPTFYQLNTYRSGNYHWYAGEQLTSPYPTDVFRLKITHSTYTYYSDWIDPGGFTDKTKIKISSSYDYGGIKYVDGYEQWIYKDANVRRSPKAEIEITGDKLNGEIIKEKTVSAIRYICRMKVTEAEYEAFVHAVGCTLTITDPTDKTFNAVNIELSDPTWYRGNGIVELSFVDENNINVFTMNNTAL